MDNSDVVFDEDGFDCADIFDEVYEDDEFAVLEPCDEDDFDCADIFDEVYEDDEFAALEPYDDEDNFAFEPYDEDDLANADVYESREVEFSELMESHEVDRISSLPDDIISRILSCMPTVNALATSVLSKDWKYKWTLINSIDISDELGSKSMFTDVMERILLLHTQNLRTIRIKLVHKYNSSLVEYWTSILLKNKIWSLDIHTVQEDLVIDRKLLDSTSLRELVLKNIIFKFPACNWFANLKDLRFQHLQLRNESSNDIVSFTFPVLEFIEFVRCTWLNVKFVEIHAPALKGFKSETIRNIEVGHYTINIHCAYNKLGLFKATGGDPENIFVTGSKVVDAAFDNLIVEPFHETESRVRRLLEKFSSTLEELTLSLQVASAITGSEQRFHQLPKFHKLLRLKLTNLFVQRYGNGQSLLEILHAMPILKYLVIDMSSWRSYNYDSMEASAPRCITSSLEEIEFVEVIWSTVGSFDLINFLLQAAVNLKVCHVYPKNNGIRIMEEISAYPTGSTSLEIVGHVTSINAYEPFDDGDFAYVDVYESREGDYDYVGSD